ncbi:MAG: four helix bundle protein [Bacteroidetes bacterium]|nr:four helix bundle protein [Bacteroidota bacterium]
MLNERPHKKLVLWQEAMELVTLIYEVTKKFPKEEEFGLKSQLRRAAVSVPSNISEGLTRRTKVSKIHFLNIADGSMSEIDTQIEIALRLEFIDKNDYELVVNKLITTQKLLSGLSRSLK